MQRRVVTLFALVGAMLATAAPSASPANLRPSAPACDIAQEVAVRVDELGETGRSTWTIAPDPTDDVWAWVSGPEHVTITPSVTCDKIRSVVTHEWMHLLQGRAYPGRAQRAYGGHEEFEVVADCGSALLGGNYMPYFDVFHPCTPSNYESARYLIEQSGMAGAVGH